MSQRRIRDKRKKSEKKKKKNNATIAMSNYWEKPSASQKCIRSFVRPFIQRSRLWPEFSRNRQHSGPKHASERLEHVCITYIVQKTRLMIVNLTPLAIVFRYARYPRFESQRDRYAILMENIYIYV